MLNEGISFQFAYFSQHPNYVGRNREKIRAYLTKGTISNSDLDVIISCLQKPSEKEVRVNLEVARPAFSIQYQNPEKAVTHLSSFVEKCIIKYAEAPDKYYGLYFSIAQSSGWGKSRTALELGECLNVVYGCIRETDSGYPLQNKELYTYLTTNTQEEHMKYFIVATYITAEIFRLNNPSDLPLRRFKKGDSPFEGFWKAAVATAKKCMNSEAFRIKCQVFFDAIQRKFTLPAYKNRKHGKAIYGGKEQLSELVIVIDEARTLLMTENSDAFFNLRRALGIH